MFNITIKDKTTYAEVPQVNPLKWKTLFKEADNTFVDQSGWIKCKDFYNDTVAFFKAGSVFSIYSYQNQVKKNEEGVYFLLKFIKDKKSFFLNIEMMNKQLFKDLKCSVGVWDHKDDEVVVLIPNELWESTYRISMVTMVIRLCNYGVLYETWADLWKDKAPAISVDHAFTPEAIANAKEYGFLVPKQYKGYWYYAGKAHNSRENPSLTGSIIHNNGVSNWSMFMKQEGA